MREIVNADQRAASATVAQRAAAFRRLAGGQLDDSYRLASAILGNPTDARDVVHDAFITGWRRWPSLRDSDRFGAWFKRIVVNTCKDRKTRIQARMHTVADGRYRTRTFREANDAPDVIGRAIG